MSKSNRWVLPIFLVSLAFLPASALAQTAGGGGLKDFVSFFTPQPTDFSLMLLSMMYGTVGNVLVGRGGQLLGQLMGIFNGGLVIVMGVVFGYTTLKYVLQAASEGQLMGERGKLGMAVLRSSLGIVLAIPSKATGYCLAQVLVMWLVVQSVGFANQAWDRVLNYLTEGGVVLENTFTMGSSVNKSTETVNGTKTTTDDRAALISNMQYVLAAQTCLSTVRSLAQAQSQSNSDTASNLNASTGLNASSSGSTFSYNDLGSSFNPDNSITFGSRNTEYDPAKAPATSDPNYGKYGYAYNSECGKVMLTNFSEQQGTVWESAPQYQSSAYAQSISDLQSTADSIAASSTAATTGGTSQDLSQLIPMGLTRAGLNYINLIAPVRRASLEEANKGLYTALERAKSLGWIMAGTYYRYMGQAGSQAQETINKTLAKIGGTIDPFAAAATPEGAAAFNIKSLSDTDQETVKNAIASANTASYQTDAVNDLGQVLEKPKAAAPGGPFSSIVSKKTSATIAGSAIALSLAGGPGAMITVPGMAIVLVSTAQHFADAVNLSKNPDPILALQKLGFYMMDTAMIWFLTTAAVFFGVTLASAFALSTQLTTAIVSSMDWIKPLVFAFMTFMLGTGGMLAFYVPLIIFIVWLPAVIGWFASTFQAMIGAPLVALRLVDPEGEGIIGKAGEGFTMVFGVFMTPIILVFGFVGAVLASRLIMWVINLSFAILFEELYAPTHGMGPAYVLIGIPMFMLIYTMLAITVQQVTANTFLVEGTRMTKGYFAAAMQGHQAEAIAHEMKSGVKGMTDSSAQSLGASEFSGKSSLKDAKDAKAKEDEAKRRIQAGP